MSVSISEEKLFPKKQSEPRGWLLLFATTFPTPHYEHLSQPDSDISSQMWLKMDVILLLKPVPGAVIGSNERTLLSITQCYSCNASTFNQLSVPIQLRVTHQIHSLFIPTILTVFQGKSMKEEHLCQELPSVLPAPWLDLSQQE